MPISPADFYAVAETLQRGKTVAVGEPCDRTVIGRAYYASYLALRDSLRTAYRDPLADVDHRDLRRGLAKASDTEVADVGLRLKSLWDFRRQADYEPAQSISPLTAALMLSNAKHILKMAPQIVAKFPAGILTK